MVKFGSLIQFKENKSLTFFDSYSINQSLARVCGTQCLLNARGRTRGMVLLFPTLGNREGKLLIAMTFGRRL